MSTSMGLKDIASRKGIAVGCCINDAHLNEGKYRSALVRNFNLAPPEYELMHSQLCPTRGKYDFENADKVVAFALKHKMRIRGHPLVWQSRLNIPSWLARQKLSRSEAAKLLKDHIMTVMKRYKNEIHDWVVVNEAMNDDFKSGKFKLRKGFWFNRIGPRYVEMAFRLAHIVDPKATLWYNDYSMDEINGKSDAVYRLIKGLLKKGAPIHAIGLQMHLASHWNLDPKSVEANIRRFQKLGLKVGITEMDVRIRKPVTKKKLKKQAKMYSGMLRVALNTRCEDFSLWGVTDAVSWIPESHKGYDAGLILDKKYRPKLAYENLVEALNE